MNIKIEKFAEKYLSEDKFIKYLLFYRIFLSFFAEFVVIRYTRLGDVNFFMKNNPAELFKKYGFNLFFREDELPRFIVSAVHSVLQIDVLCYVVFAVLGYFGIKKFLQAAAGINKKYYRILIFLCYLPSFNLWSSIAGKEAFLVFSMGIIGAEIIRFFKGEKIKIGFLFIIAVWFAVVMKKQYIPFIVFTIPYIFFRPKLKISWHTDLILLFVLFVLSIGAVYWFRVEIDNFALKVHNVFRVSARSTRDRIFIEQFDFFKKMPYLLPLSLWGPSFAECGKSMLHIFSFAESAVLFGSVFYLLKDAPKKIFKKFKIYYQWFIFGINSLMFLFIAHYMQGIMNPGAGIRYRTNIYLAMIAFVCGFICIKEKEEKNDEVAYEKPETGK